MDDSKNMEQDFWNCDPELVIREMLKSSMNKDTKRMSQYFKKGPEDPLIVDNNQLARLYEEDEDTPKKKETTALDNFSSHQQLRTGD